LGLTQSGISHAITELEDLLGARLLVRARTGCTPTDAGHRVLAGARLVLRTAAGLAAAAEGDARLQGHVRIACFRSVATHLLPPALDLLATRHPELRVDVDDGYEERAAVEAAVREGRAELAVAQLPVADGLFQRAFAADAYVFVAPAALRCKGGWEQFGALPYIQLDCSGAYAVLDACRAAGFAARPARTLATDSGVLALVRRGLGYSILPRLAVHPLPDGVQVLDLPIPAARKFAIVGLPDVVRGPAVQAVLAALADKALLRRTDPVRHGIALA
ncbi:MAG TPA: LysR family transcriptional regulator, partial [Telluria sp.]|nr:LysR family transcriptional regulator [Telluria sp.]